VKDLFIDVASGEVIEIETSKESIAETKALQEQLAANAANAANAKASAQAKLAALGLTADDLKALGL
jgi:hypothetical protein